MAAGPAGRPGAEVLRSGLPAMTSPVLTPVCSSSRTSHSRSSRSFSSARAACMPAAARTARRASSSWVAGMPNTAMTASPANFSPPCPVVQDQRPHGLVAGHDPRQRLGVEPLAEHRLRPIVLDARTASPCPDAWGRAWSNRARADQWGGSAALTYSADLLYPPRLVWPEAMRAPTTPLLASAPNNRERDRAAAWWRTALNGPSRRAAPSAGGGFFPWHASTQIT